MPFTLRNLKEDLEDVGSGFDGAPDLEFRLATHALELERSGLGYQPVARKPAGRSGVTRLVTCPGLTMPSSSKRWQGEGR